MSSSRESLVSNEDNGMPGLQSKRAEVYRRMKRYLALTCQCWSIDKDTSKAKRILYHFLQSILALFAFFYFVYTFGFFGSSKKPYNIGYCFFYYPITVVEGAMWEFRWLVTCWLGLWCTRKVWRNTFEGKLKNIILGKNRWKKVKSFSWRLLGLALPGMLILNVLEDLITINFRISQLNLGLAILVDAFMNILDRILAFPLFFLFCVTMYTLCCMVEEYRHDIEIGTWGTNNEPGSSESSGEFGDGDEREGIENIDANSARERFRKIKDAIRITGLSFELYLTIHFLFLVCTFFLGVCACFEQMEVRVDENYTMPLPFQMPRNTRFITFFGNLSVGTDYTVQVAGTAPGSATLLTPSHVYYESNAFNYTEIPSRDEIRTEWIMKSMRDIVFCSLAKTFESLLLYMLPVGLMVRLDNRLRGVYEVIEDSNVEIHPLFNNVEGIRRMCKYVKTAHGLKIYGYTVPKFQSIMLAAFGTFFAVIIQRLLLHIHMKKE